MYTVSQTIFDYRRVRIVRRCNYNSVNLARVNEGFGGVKAFYLAASVMAFLLGALKLCGIDIGYRGENQLKRCSSPYSPLCTTSRSLIYMGFVL